MVVVFLMACGTDAGQQQRRTNEGYDAEDSTLLRVAVTPTLDCLPLYLAEKNGFFQQQGVTVVLRRYQAQMDQDTAMERGRAELFMTDLVRAERMQQRGLPLQYLTSTNLGWQLYTSKLARIKRLEQLDDKMLAMTRYSGTALLADYAVDSARLGSERVFRIQVNDVGVRLNMLEGGIMDALLLPEPQATQARLLGCPMLLDSRQLDICLGVMAARKDMMTDSLRHAQVEAFLNAYNMACDSINKYGVESYRHLIVENCGVTSTTADSLPMPLHFEHVQPPRPADVERAKAWLERQIHTTRDKRQ